MLWGWSWSVGTTLRLDYQVRGSAHASITTTGPAHRVRRICAVRGLVGEKKEKCCSSLWLLRCGCVLLAVAVVVTCWWELGANETCLVPGFWRAGWLHGRFAAAFL
eukprot:6087280-Prymnesium_polylepis.1